jgi:hypothetical protein
LIVEAGTVALLYGFAATEREKVMEKFQGNPHCRAGWKWAKITASVSNSLAGYHYFGPFIPNCYLNERVVFVVSEDDIITGTMFFYKGCFKEKSFFFCSGKDGFYPPDTL